MIYVLLLCETLGLTSHYNAAPVQQIVNFFDLGFIFIGSREIQAKTRVSAKGIQRKLRSPPFPQQLSILAQG